MLDWHQWLTSQIPEMAGNSLSKFSMKEVAPFTLWSHVPVNCERDNVKRKVSKSCVSCNITAAASKHNTSNHCIIKSTEPVYCSMFPLSSEHWVSIFLMFLACQMTIVHCVLENQPFGCREKWKIRHEGFSSDLHDRLHIKWMPPFTEICRHGNTYF